MSGFRVEINGRTLELKMNGETLLRHSPGAPMFACSDSLPELRLHHGAWSAQGRILPESPLQNFEYDESTGRLSFWSSKRRLELALSERDGAVELRVLAASREIGRVALHLYLDPNAEVYGGGATGARDLRGLDPLVWAGEGLESGVRAAMRSRAKRCGLGSTAPQLFFHDSDGHFVAAEHAGGCVAQFSRRGHVELELWGVPDAIFVGFEPELKARLEKPKLIGAQRLMPPRWSIEGASIGVSGGEEELLLRVDAAVRAGLRTRSVYIRDWSGMTRTGAPFEDFAVSTALYPRIGEILSRLHGRGIRAIARVAPLLSPDGENYAEAARRGYLLTDATGAPALTDRGGMFAHLDLENADARAWAARKIRENVFGAGFSAVSAEDASCEPPDALCAPSPDRPGGEKLLLGDVRPAGSPALDRASRTDRAWSPDLARAMLYHNRRAARWIEVCREAAGPKNAVFAHSGAALGRAHAPMLAGEPIDHALGLGIRSLVDGILGLSAVGVAAGGIDPSALIAAVPPQLRSLQLVRMAELSAFLPHFRIAWQSEQAIGLDPSDRELIDNMARLHGLLAASHAVKLDEWTKGGLPPLCHTLDIYPELAGAKHLSEQLVFDRDLVFAPVCDVEKNSVEIVLPDGAWVDLMSGANYTGGTHTVESLPGHPAAFYRHDGKNAAFYRYITAELAL